MKVLAFGEVLWDVYSDSEHIGGAPLNFAAHVVKCGGESTVLTAVGNDDLGKKTLDAINGMGISAEYIYQSDKSTGKCLVKLDSNLVPTYNLLDDVAYDDIQLVRPVEDKFDVLYFGTLALRSENNMAVIADLIETTDFADVFVDMNLRAPYYNEKVIKFACKNASILKISLEELPDAAAHMGIRYDDTKPFCTELSTEYANIKLVLITLGDKGSMCYDVASDKFFSCDGVKVDVVSTVGAGDSFSASFLAKYYECCDIDTALAFGVKISAYVVSQQGAIPEYNLADF